MKPKIIETRRRITTATSLAMADALKKRGYTDQALADAHGLGAAAVARWRRLLREETGNVYVEGYALDAMGRPFTPIWRMGAGTDAERPGRTLTPAEQMRKTRANRKGS